MNTYEWLLIGHLLGVFVILMAGGISGGTAMASTRASSAAGVVELLKLQRMSDLYMFSVGAVVAVIFGSLLVNEAGFSFGDPWISTAFVIVVVMLGVVHAVMAPRAKRAREYAESLGSGPVDEELKTKLGDPLMNLGGLVLTISLIVLLWLMVTKPGA
jgi:uncharacterized membrane protein